MEHAETQGHIVDQRTFVAVWGALVLLTTLLVYVARSFHEFMAVVAMLTITPLKASLVFYYFMHLKYEAAYLRSMVFVTLALLTMLIAMTFLDLSYR